MLKCLGDRLPQLATTGLFTVLAMGGATLAGAAVQVSKATFGSMPDGKAVEIFTLKNQHGLVLKVMSLGASIQGIEVPDKQGHSADVVLGYDTLDGYLQKSQYFGATVGRFANRIAGGKFKLDGREYSVPVNDGPNSLHGGVKGFDKLLWTVKSQSSGATGEVIFTLHSADADQGYPGNVDVTAIYRLDEQDRISVEYRAKTDKPTLMNLSNHAYYNLAGVTSDRSVLDHLLTLHAEEITPVSSTLIPTGELRKVAGTVFDFRQPKPIGRDIRDYHEQQLVFGKGYDHNWVVSHAPAKTVRLQARVEDPVSGRVLEVESDQPGIQFYSGNFLDGTTVGKGGHTYRQGDAFVLEPQLFPDAPNHPEFSSARLNPGSEYVNHIVLHFLTAK